MAHQRKLIRQAVVAKLAAANTAAGARVSPTRVEPNKKSELPAISVYTLHDPVDESTTLTAPVEQRHELQLEITAWVGHTDGYPVDDRMDDIAEQIETAMDLDPYLTNAQGVATASDSWLTGTEMQVVEDDGRSDPLVGIVTLTYLVRYYQARAVPALTASFVTANVEHRIVGAVQANEAVDTVQEPQ